MNTSVPQGQYVTPKMPIMSFGSTPRIDRATWRLRIFGKVQTPIELTWDDYVSLTHEQLVADFHCVTQWTRLDVEWEGVSPSRVLEFAKPTLDAKFAMIHCYDGYTTNVDLPALLQSGTLFAFQQQGIALANEHGGPLRLVVPTRYGWKSAKWVKAVQLMGTDAPGFWETRGYHMRGDPWREERFSEY